MTFEANPVSMPVSSWLTSQDAGLVALANSADQSGEPDFKELMTLLILSSFSGGAMGNSGSSGIGGGMSEIMMPLMLTLLEQILASQVEAETAPEASPAQPTPQGLPIRGRVTQKPHAGHMALDFGAPVGTPVKATMDGKVVYAGWNDEGYGKLVIVQNGPFRTYFAHLSKIPVNVGQTVQAGMVLGFSGDTGNSTGPHLHYEVRKNGRAIDPTEFTFGPQE